MQKHRGLDIKYFAYHNRHPYLSIKPSDEDFWQPFILIGNNKKITKHNSCLPYLMKTSFQICFNFSNQYCGKHGIQCQRGFLQCHFARNCIHFQVRKTKTVLQITTINCCFNYIPIQKFKQTLDYDLQTYLRETSYGAKIKMCFMF